MDIIKIHQDIYDGIETFFFPVNYNIKFLEVNQHRVLFGFDVTNVPVVSSENKWIIEQWRKYVGTHKMPILRLAQDGSRDGYTSLKAEVEQLINNAPEMNNSPKEQLYCWVRDEWLGDLYRAVSEAADLIEHVDETEEYDA